MYLHSDENSVFFRKNPKMLSMFIMQKNAPRNHLRMCWIWFLFSFKCLAIVLPSLEYSSDKNTFFSYISKGFLISQIAFAKNRCFFTKDKFFDTYIFERDLKVWFYRIFILFAFQRYITFADISKIQARRLKKKKLVVVFLFLECCDIYNISWFTSSSSLKFYDTTWQLTC